MRQILLAFLAAVMLASAAFAAGGGGGSIVVKKEPEPEKPAYLQEISQDEADSLKCSTLATINERVSCRINLEQENELYYLPEECRALDGGSREKCKAFYSSVQVCWNRENRHDPVGCARNKLGLSESIAADVAGCGSDALCIAAVADKVHSLAKFRLYNLEWKAEYLVEEGISVNHELLVDLVVNLELKKQEYNAAETIPDKIGVLRAAQRIWQKFAERIKQQEGL
ncbi:hypothetical protein HYX10_02390 [Candidatus Woesearchaeota archaeon]|nr:hypothetical protein [Candidatus Woesearchaeota archaeon]